MALSSSWRPASVMVIKCFVATTGIHHSGLVASPPMDSCFNPTFKSKNSGDMHRHSKVWTRHRFARSISIAAKLHTIMVSTCWLTKSSDQKTRSLRLNAVMPLRLECQNSARVKFHDGRLSYIIISNVKRLFLRRILRPMRSNIIQMVTRH